jgi:hypothetical protein
MMSVPVAATAISLSFGNCFSVSARMGTLLMMAMSASFRRSTISSCVQVD